VKKKKPQIIVDAEQARHYWKSAAAAVSNNSTTVLADISRTMDGEVKRSGKTVKEAEPPKKAPENHEETIVTFLNSWFLHEYVFRARYVGHPCVLDMYPHRLAWGYPWQFLKQRPTTAEEGHRYISIPMVSEDIYISVWNNIKGEIEAQYPEPVTAEWILWRVFAHLPKNTPLLDLERAQIEEDFRREQ
jgi:hypothetical protein